MDNSLIKSPVVPKHIWWQIFNRMDHLSWDSFKDTLRDVPVLKSVVAQYLLFNGPRHQLYLSIVRKVSIQEHGDSSYHNFTQCLSGFYDQYWFCYECQKYCTQQSYSVVGHCTECGEHMNIYHSSLNAIDVLTGGKNPWICSNCNTGAVEVQVAIPNCQLSGCINTKTFDCYCCKLNICNAHAYVDGDRGCCETCWDYHIVEWKRGFHSGWWVTTISVGVCLVGYLMAMRLSKN